MNCEQIRERLPLLIYGDVNADEARKANEHLADCPACRHERDALLTTRQALDAPTVPEVAVDVASIHAQALAMQARSMRRWKRFAVAAAALAASLLAFLLIRPDVRVGDGQLVIRWGPEREQPPALAQAQPSRDSDLEERIRLLNSLVHSLQKQMDSSDQQFRKDVEFMLV